MTSPCPNHPRRAQRGVALVFAMIALVVLLIGAAAIMQSMNTSLFTAGNLGFKRDLTNQGERALNAVVALIDTGALGTEAARQADNKARNYSATIFTDTNAQGIPAALLSDTAFNLKGVAGNDITINDMGVTVRYVIDRLCAAGTAAVSPTACSVAGNVAPSGGSSSDLSRAEDSSAGGAGALVPQAIYRISIRVSGPRGTQSFFQATLTI